MGTMPLDSIDSTPSGTERKDPPLVPEEVEGFGDVSVPIHKVAGEPLGEVCSDYESY